jgi:hypothetical protein
MDDNIICLNCSNNLNKCYYDYQINENNRVERICCNCKKYNGCTRCKKINHTRLDCKNMTSCCIDKFCKNNLRCKSCDEIGSHCAGRNELGYQYNYCHYSCNHSACNDVSNTCKNILHMRYQHVSYCDHIGYNKYNFN